VPDVQRQSPDRDHVRERDAGDVDVHASVEFGAMCAVHLAPASVAVGGEPQVGFVEVTEHDELLHHPRR
jgi:hypothetical protein